MKYTSKIALACAAALIVAVVFSIVRARQALTPEQIFMRTVATYAGSKSYRDSGTVKTSSAFGDVGTLSIEGTFTTAFIRPDRFRYEFKGKMTRPVSGEYKSRDIHYIVWRKGKETYRFFGIRKPGVEKSESLAMAVAGATGISGGLATMTVDMLLPDEFQGSTRITDFKEVTRLEDAKVGEIDCFCIQGKMVDRSTTVWIDKQNFLIRRMDWNEVIKNTTIWEPTINEEIADEALEFNPPQQ
jgi:outer membrane lipoprotein-sorting protein